MINVSNEFKQVINGDERVFYPSAEITLADSTVLSIGKERITQLKIEDSTSQSGSFSIGSAIINKLTLSIDNMDDAYSDYDFTDAVIRPSVGLQLSASIETLNKGVFIADDPHVKSSTITLTALDNMVKFDKPFSNIVQAFPCSAINLLNTVCTHCGVSLGTSTFDGDDYVIQSRPSTSDATNCREIVSWIAQLGGNFARCNINGALEIKWYDLSVFEEETNLDGGYFDETQVTFTESKSGTSVTSSETAKDSTAEITKIEGASSQAVTVQGANIIDVSKMGNVTYVNKGSFRASVWSSTILTNAQVKQIFKPSTTYYVKCKYTLEVGSSLPVFAYQVGFNLYSAATGTLPIAFNNSLDVVGETATMSVSFTTPADLADKTLLFYSNRYTNGTTVEFGRVLVENLIFSETNVAYSDFIPNSPSPLYPSPIITPSNFNLTASQGTESNQVSVTQTLRKLSDTVFDSIEKVNGVTKYIQRVGVKSFTGAENWGKNNFRFQLANGIIGGVNTNLYANAKNVSCTHFMNHVNEDQLYSGAYDNAVGLFLQTGTTGYIGFVNKSTATIADFKAFLAAQNSAGNPVTVYYPLATPIETIIPDLTLTTYKGTTSITTTSNPQVSITAAFNETIGVQDKYYSGDSADGGTFSFVDGDNIDGGSFTIQNRYHGITFHTGLSLSTDDVVITGITAYDSSEQANSYTFGTSGYLIQIEKNELIQSQSDAQTVATLVGNKLVGTRFRPLSLTAKSNPSIEAGDVTKVSDRKGNVYNAFLSNVSYAVWQSMKLSCDAESPTRNSATRYSVETKTVAKATHGVEQKLTAYDLMVQQLNNLITHSFGFYSSEEVLEDGSKIYYKHDRPTRAESTKIWKETIDAFAVSTDGGVTYTAGFDVDGNAVLNVLSAIGINADWIRTGKLLSNDGATLIDMAYGVANSDNISFVDNVQSGYPLKMPFNIDESVSKINKVTLKYTIDKFRTYSDGASSGGGNSATSSDGGGSQVTSASGGVYTNGTGLNGAVSHKLVGTTTGSGGYYADATGSTTSSPGVAHSHSYGVPAHSHSYTYDIEVLDHTHILDIPGHTHSISLPSHTHDVSIPAHSHLLNFGIMETDVTDNAIQVYIDGILRLSTSDTQGIADLTTWVTTTGWHTIELRSTTLKRISAQVVIKSYIRS